MKNVREKGRRGRTVNRKGIMDVLMRGVSGGVRWREAS